MKPVTIISAEEAKAKAIQKKYSRELQVANELLERASFKINAAVDRGEFTASISYQPSLIGDIGYTAIKSGLESLGYDISTRSNGEDKTAMEVITINW